MTRKELVAKLLTELEGPHYSIYVDPRYDEHMDPKEALQFKKNPIKWYCERLECTEQELQAYFEIANNDWEATCLGTTYAGKPCNNVVKCLQDGPFEFLEWIRSVSFDSLFCHLHKPAKTQ